MSAPNGRREEKEAVAAFIEDLYARGGFASWAEFAREAGIAHASTISDYRRAANAPSGYSLLRLIQAAERRHATALEEAALSTDPEVGFALRMVRDMRRPLPVPDEELEADRDYWAKAWDEAGRPESDEVEPSAPPDLPDHQEELRDVVAAIQSGLEQKLIPAMTDVQERLGRVEAALPLEEDPPTDLAEDG